MRRRVAIAALIAAASIARADGERELVTLTLDGAVVGDRVILVGERDDVWVDAVTLCDVRICKTEGFALDDAGTRYLRLATLGIRYTLDREAGELVATTDPKSLAETTIDLRRTRPVTLEHLSATSLFVNYGLHGGVDVGEERTTTVASGFGEAGLSTHGVLVYSSVNATAGRVIRGLSNATWDLRDHMMTAIAGDDVVTGGVLGGGGVIAGLHLRREFALDPYFIWQPTLTQTGVVTTPSTIEVYRDGQLVRRETLAPGPFRVHDLVGSVGAESRVIIRDALGLAQQVMTSSFVAPQSALAAGLSQFSYSAGVLRRNLGTESFDYGPLAGSAVHRRGITNRVTGSATGELSADLLRGGTGVLVAFGRASIELEGAASATPAGGGGAASLAIGWHAHRFSASATLRSVSARYATLQLAPEVDRALYEAMSTLSWSPARRLSLSIQGGRAILRDAGERLHVGAAAGVQLGNDLRAQLSTAASRADDGGRSFEAMATLAWTFGVRTTGTAATGLDSSGRVAAGSISRALAQEDGIGYQAQARTGASSSGLARVEAQARFGRASATAQWLGQTGTANVELAGGIVAIGGRVKATRPVQGGFALVRVPGAENVRGYLDNRDVGRTDSEGDLIIPDLQAYYGNRVRIDMGDLPLRFALDSLERVVAPPRRGGIIVQMTRDPLPLVRGTLALRDGSRVIDASFGDLVLEGRTAAPIGRGGLFELEALARGEYQATALVDGRRCAFVIDTRGSRGDTVELGNVQCTFPVHLTEAR